jgi:alanyl-tRNA synthetase
VGTDAYQFLAREHLLVQRLSELVKAPADEVLDRVERTIASLKDAERELGKVRSAQLAASVDGIIGEGTEIGPVRLWAFQAPDGTSAGDLRELAMKAKGRARQGSASVFVGFAVADAKASVVAAATPEAIALGVSASALLQAAAGPIDGRGGGKEEFAQGGGSNTSGIRDALTAVSDLVRERVGA